MAVIDPGKMQVKIAYDSYGKGALISGTSVALQIKDSIFVGSFQGNRILRLPANHISFSNKRPTREQHASSNSRPVQLEELEEKGKTLEAKVTSLETLEAKVQALEDMERPSTPQENKLGKPENYFM